jgi:hypothetical protein
MPSPIGTASSRFRPDRFANLQLWLDSDDASTITQETQGGIARVVGWASKVGGISLTGAYGVSRPRLTGLRNNRPTVAFDGNDFLQYAATTNINVGAVSIYVVFAETTSKDFAGVISLHATTGSDFNSTSALCIETDDNTSHLDVVRNFNGTTGTGRARLLVGSGGSTYGQYTGIYNSNGSINIFRNGTAGTSSGTVATTFGVANGGFLIGSRFTSGAVDTAQGLIGDMGEVLVYNVSHTTAQRQEVEKYLKDKWGTP